MQFRSPDSTMRIPEMAKGVWITPKIHPTRNGINWKKELTITSHHKIMAKVWPCYMSSERVHKSLLKARTGMCRSYIMQVSLVKCSKETKGKLLTYWSNLPLGLILEHGLRSSSVSELLCNSYSPTKMAPQKSHKENELLGLT